MRWIELCTSVRAEDVEPIAAVLGKFGQGGATIEEPQPELTDQQTFNIKIYLLYSRSYAAQKHRIEEALAQPKTRSPVQLKERMLKPEDWLDSLKQHFHTLAIGEKFIVRPSWAEKSPAGPGRIVIELDPGAAFGTGLHPTTQLCLLSLEKYLRPGMSVYDLGTGSGILAIAAAKLGAHPILGLDIEAAAVKSAKSNSALNNVSDLIQVRRGTLSQRARRIYRNTFDLALANITAKAISDLSSGFAKVLKPEGKLIVSGIHDQGLDEVLIRLALADFHLDFIQHEEQWHVVVASKIKLQED